MPHAEERNNIHLYLLKFTSSFKKKQNMFLNSVLPLLAIFLNMYLNSVLLSLAIF